MQIACMSLFLPFFQDVVVVVVVGGPQLMKSTGEPGDLLLFLTKIRVLRGVFVSIVEGTCGNYSFEL